jgi:hypothetical protein
MERRNPAGEIAIAHPFEAGILDHLREAFLIGEAADRFHEITVGRAVAGHQAAQHGNGA